MTQTQRLPFRLVRRDRAEPAVAALIPGSLARALGFCASARLDPMGRLFPVPGGILVRLGAPTDRPLPGAIRLRSIAADRLLLPVDADLIPALLDDEAAGLVRDRGLVFLPDGDILGFDPRSPLDLRGRLATSRPEPRIWRPLPERSRMAERIEEIELELPGPEPDGLPADLGDAPGDEEPSTEPERPGAASSMLSGASLNAGRALMWMGRALRLRSMAEMGAKWVQGAMEAAPSLGEKVVGKQAAALRSLLKEFQEGNVDRALRNALPLNRSGADPGGGTLDRSDRLPDLDPSYSLDALLKGPGRGRSGYWYAEDEVLNKLTREYRKAAEAAIRLGDYRRAAYIFGRLLGDYASAANALRSGGLHRDAAMLFLTRLDDRRSAARSFAAAGDFDRAIQLHRELGEHVEAGELLRRIGEEDAALGEFTTAAERMIEGPGGFLAAGELLKTRAARPDLALAYFRRGWEGRPCPNDVACALQSAQLLAEIGRADEVIRVVGEVGEFLATPGHDLMAADFFNRIVAVGELLPAPAAETVRDRALLGLAGKLRQSIRGGVRPGAMTSTLFGRARHWSASVAADAEFAARAEANAAPDPAEPAAKGPYARLAQGVITAITSAPMTGDVFLGMASGEVFGFRPTTGELTEVGKCDLQVASLATNEGGTNLAVLGAPLSRSRRAHRGLLDVYRRQIGLHFERVASSQYDDLVEPWLTPIYRGVDDFFGLWDGQALYVQQLPHLIDRGVIDPGGEALSAVLLIPPARDDGAYRLLLGGSNRWSLCDPDRPGDQPAGPRWAPAVPKGSTIRQAPFSWCWSGAETLELAGIDAEGSLHWSSILVDEGLQVLARNTAAGTTGYLWTAIVRPGLVAALKADRVDWFRCGPDHFRAGRSTMLSMPAPLACVFSRPTHELILIGGTGLIQRLPVPVP